MDENSLPSSSIRTSTSSTFETQNRGEEPVRLARGTVERGKNEIREMISASSALPPPVIYDYRAKPAGERPRATRRDAPARTWTEPQPSTPPAEPSARSVATAMHRAPHAVALAPENERAITTLLDEPVAIGETIEAHSRSKERRLGELFARLSVIEARVLHKRLSMPEPGDPIAARFSRMITERRNRLLVFLADARRREAIHAARR